MLYDSGGQWTVAQQINSNRELEENAYFGPNLVVRNDDCLTKHIFVNGIRLASKLDSGWMDRPAVHYYHQDDLGSVQYVSNSQQKMIQYQEYFPTGELLYDTNLHSGEVMSYLYTDKEHDRGADLYYHGARYYDPKLSQWASPDPILNLYMQGGPLYPNQSRKSVGSVALP